MTEELQVTGSRLDLYRAQTDQDILAIDAEVKMLEERIESLGKERIQLLEVQEKLKQQMDLYRSVGIERVRVNRRNQKNDN